jgi:hypothetical protein
MPAATLCSPWSGIAGEDDLDCPDLQGEAGSAPRSITDERTGSGVGSTSVHKQGNGPATGPAKRPRPPILGPEQSSALRDRLLAELEGLKSAEAAWVWAKRALVDKNSLAAGDASVVEEAFGRQLRQVVAQAGAEIGGASDVGTTPSTAAAVEAGAGPESAQGDPDLSKIDKSVLMLGEPRRHRDREHLSWIKRQPCLICGRTPSDAHHLRFMQPRALGRKVSDEFAVPLCRVHHRAVHRAHPEPSWWDTFGIDPVKIAHGLWKQTRLNEGLVASPNPIPSSEGADSKSAASSDAR